MATSRSRNRRAVQLKPRPFAPEYAEKLKIEYGMAGDYHLLQELNDAVEFYQLVEHALGGRRAARDDADLRKLTKQARQLRKSLHGMDIHLNRLISASGVYQHTDIHWSNSLTENLLKLETAAAGAQQELPKDSGGHPGRLDHHLIVRLANIFHRGTGKNPEKLLGHDRLSGSYGGSFFQFVRECFETIGVRIKSEAGLGKAIERSLKRARKTSSRQRQNPAVSVRGFVP
jgi:hypothetical protein